MDSPIDRRLLITGGTVVTMNSEREIIDDGAVLVRGDRIEEVGEAGDLEGQHPDVERIDARGKAVIPGMVNTHTHLFQTLLKGLGDDKALYDWFRFMAAPASVHLTDEDCYAAARHGCLEALLSGATTLVDFMYAHPRPHLTDAVIRAFEETGIRGIVARGFVTAGEELGVPGPLIESWSDALEDCERLIRGNNQPGVRVRVGMAPCILWTVDEETLRETRSLAEQVGGLLTVHVSETHFEVEQSLRQYRTRELDVMDGCGFLGHDVLAVHCVKCNDRDIRIMRHYDVKVSHNPCSNMYLASGVAPIPQMLSAGITVGLATDGPASNNNQNMVHALKYGALLHKVATEDATVITAEKMLEMATIDGARALGMEDEIGSLEPGKKADLVVLNFDNPFVSPVHHPVSALVYAALGNEAETVLVDGRIVVRHRQPQTVDLAEVIDRTERSALAVARRSGVDRLARRPWRSIAY